MPDKPAEVLLKIFGKHNFISKEITHGASTRKYYRILGPVCRKYLCDSLVISHFIGYARHGFENFLKIQKILKNHQVTVPEIYHVWKDYKAIAMEDIGQQSLESLFPSLKREKVIEIYKKILDDLIRIHSISAGNYKVFTEPFDRGNKKVSLEEIYLYDLENHANRFLFEDFFKTAHLNYDLLKGFYSHICNELRLYISTLMYRDFQSSNIYYRKSTNSLCYIDFQDARLGVPFYDLASLLWDAYIPMNRALRSRLMDYYFSRLNLNKKYLVKILEYCVIQRKLHDAGAFARAYQISGKRQFLKFIKPSIRQAVFIMKHYKEFSKATSYLYKITKV